MKVLQIVYTIEEARIQIKDMTIYTVFEVV